LLLAEEVDAHWRGIYDILVRPAGAQLDIETTNGLVEPNYLGFTGRGGISRAQLEAIRAMPSVEVAAPVAYVGLLTTNAAAPTIHISSLPAEPTLYRVTIDVETSDGLRPHLVQRSVHRVLLGPGPEPQVPLVASDVPGQSVGISTDPEGDIAVDVGTVDYLPPLSSPILAVDPAAEKALLGGSGAFLAPLEDLSADGPFTASTFDPGRVLPGYEARVVIEHLRSGTSAMQGRPVYPMLVSRRVYAPLSVRLEVGRVGVPLSEIPFGIDGAQLIDLVSDLVGPGITHAGASSVDLGSALRPLRVNNLSIPWPGSNNEPGPTEIRTSTTFNARIAARPTYSSELRRPEDDVPRFRIEPTGIVGPGGSARQSTSNNDGPEVGREQSYRTLTSLPIPVAEGFVQTGGGDTPYVLAPVGEYDLGSLDIPNDPLSYAPLGAYDPPDTTLVLDPAGRPIGPTAMSPTLNPAGLLDVPPLAITDLAAAEGLRGPAPIDAVRVRVAGLTDFGPESIAAVETLASRIMALGLQVDIVAGSSPQAVYVYVPAYDTTSDPPADLGEVQQHWTTLGAATRIVQGVRATDQALLLLSLLTIVVVVFGVQAVDGTARDREAAILGAYGWGRRRVITWFVAEGLVGGSIVLVSGAVAWMLLSRDPIGLVMAIVTAALFPSATFTSAALLTRPAMLPTERKRACLPGASSVASVRSYALSAVLRRPWRSLAILLGMAAASVAIAAAVALIAAVGSRVGPTLLAAEVSARLQVFQLAMLVLAGAGGIGFVWLALSRDLTDRSRELEVLDAFGWSPATVRTTLRWQRATYFAPAAVLAFGIAVVLGPPATDDAVSGIAIGVVAALLSTSAVVWGAVARPRRRP
jgi:hypothetical protein